MEGKNLRVENGDLTSMVNKLKQQDGKDIIVYGGDNFVSSLIKEGLIDGFNFFVHPVMINKGLRTFDLLNERQKLSLISATAYDCGICVLRYNALASDMTILLRQGLKKRLLPCLCPIVIVVETAFNPAEFNSRKP